MKTIEECREELNELDPIIKELFIKRMKIVKDVALYKKANGMEVFDSIREKQMIQKLSNNIESELKEYYLRFLNDLLIVSKDYQKEVIKD